MILDANYSKHLQTNMQTAIQMKSSEVAKLMKVVKLKDKQLAEAKSAVDEKQTLAESKDAEPKKMVAESREKETINSLSP